MNALKAQMALCGVTSKELAKALNISKSAMYRKLKGVTSFKQKEISILIDYLEISDPMAIFFAD